MYDDEYVIIEEDDDLDDDDFRNARRRRPKRRPGRGGGRRPGRLVARPRRPRRPGRRPENAGPLIREDTGGLSTGLLIEAGAQVLAAIQSLPSPPVATGETSTDLGNLILYQQAIAEHAKRDEQLRTVGSLAAKFFA